MELPVITLSAASEFHWYQVDVVNGMIPLGMCVQYIGFNPNTKRHHVIGESIFDEIGYYIHEDEAEKIKLMPLVF